MEVFTQPSDSSLNEIPTRLGLFANQCNSNLTEVVIIIDLQGLGILERREGGPLESTNINK